MLTLLFNWKFIMFEKILIATDFSRYSRKIVDCVCEIPGVNEAILLHVVARNPLARIWSPGDKIKEAYAKLEESKKSLESSGLKVKSIVEPSEENKEYRVIQRIADRENASLIIMGARERSILEGILRRSVSADVLRYGNKHLLIIHYKAITEAHEAKEEKFCSLIFSKVLLPTDFSTAGNAAIDAIKSTKLANNVVLLNIVAKGKTVQKIEARVKDSQNKLDRLKNELVEVGINASAIVQTIVSKAKIYDYGGAAEVNTAPLVSVEAAVEKILATTKEQDVSLIALSSYRKGWLDQATIGSVVFDVARMGIRPVLVIRSNRS